MRTRSNLTPLGTRNILGKRVAISEFKNVRFYRIGTCNIQAKSVEEAVEKYIECKTKGDSK